MTDMEVRHYCVGVVFGFLLGIGVTGLFVVYCVL